MLSEFVMERPGRCVCSVCGATWKPKRDTLPQRCPQCKSKIWKNSHRHTCCNCGHVWFSSNPAPNRCPGCQSRRWNSQNTASNPDRPVQITEKTRQAVIIRYELGSGCVRIARDLDLTFDTVFGIVKTEYPETEVRLGCRVTSI